ncbi:hypothetical protein AN169_07940 [Staphylococcus aureus]|nr:hypothetical protein AN169_07940 [Staphylococcus aureus]
MYNMHRLIHVFPSNIAKVYAYSKIFCSLVSESNFFEDRIILINNRLTISLSKFSFFNVYFEGSISAEKVGALLYQRIKK